MQPHPFRFLHDHSAEQKPLVAISACLTGAAVRYDGADKYQAGVDDWLRLQTELLPICPELDAGLGVPRPPVQLVCIDGETRALGRDDASLDVTAALLDNAQRSVIALRQLPLCGYLWKSRSPSCGLGSTPLFDRSGQQTGLGSGLQAHTIATALPWLAMAEEGTLQDESERWRFLFGCRLVFDSLYAGSTTPQQLVTHYHTLLCELDQPESETLRLATTGGDLNGVVAVLLRSIAAQPAAALRRRIERG